MPERIPLILEEIEQIRRDLRELRDRSREDLRTIWIEINLMKNDISRNKGKMDVVPWIAAILGALISWIVQYISSRAR